MALNAKSVQGKAFEYEPVAPGTYPARLVAVIDLGLQAQQPYQGKEKAPARELAITFELVDEFMKDEDGEPDPKKPRWITDKFPFFNLDSDRAKSTIRYKSLDPDVKHDGDWAALIGTPCHVTIVHNPVTQGKNKGRIYENVAGVALMRQKDADKCDPLVNPPIIFDLDEPNTEMFNRLPPFLQRIIKGNLEYAGSELEKKLGKEPAPAKKEEKKAAKPARKAEVADDDEVPY